MTNLSLIKVFPPLKYVTIPKRGREPRYIMKKMRNYLYIYMVVYDGDEGEREWLVVQSFMLVRGMHGRMHLDIIYISSWDWNTALL